MHRFSREKTNNSCENKSRTMCDAGLKGVVVFTEQIFNLVQLRNMEMNYNEHNPLGLFFPERTEVGTLLRLVH